MLRQREGVAVIETIPTTDELLAAWRDAQRHVEQLRLDSPGRAAAEDRLHDARIAYHDRIEQAAGDESEVE